MAILGFWHFLKFCVWADAIFRHIPPLFDLCLRAPGTPQAKLELNVHQFSNQFSVHLAILGSEGRR